MPFVSDPFCLQRRSEPLQSILLSRAKRSVESWHAGLTPLGSHPTPPREFATVNPGRPQTRRLISGLDQASLPLGSTAPSAAELATHPTPVGRNTELGGLATRPTPSMRDNGRRSVELATRTDAAGGGNAERTELATAIPHHAAMSVPVSFSNAGSLLSR